MDAISQKIPIENFGINNKEEKFIKLENNNNNNNNNKILIILIINQKKIIILIILKLIIKNEVYQILRLEMII